MKLYRLSLIPICTALTAAGAFIRIPMVPVPITMQTFFVVLSGILLGPKAGPMSQIIYILVGLLGLPVFSGGGGLSYVMKPTFGYLLGFICASFAAGYVMKDRPFTSKRLFIASALGMFMVYLLGTPYLAGYLYFIMKKPDAIAIAIQAGLLVFIPGCVAKCIVISLVVPKIASIKAIQKMM